MLDYQIRLTGVTGHLRYPARRVAHRQAMVEIRQQVADHHPTVLLAHVHTTRPVHGDAETSGAANGAGPFKVQFHCVVLAAASMGFQYGADL
jgi:hypothetical protein